MELLRVVAPRGRDPRRRRRRRRLALGVRDARTRPRGHAARGRLPEPRAGGRGQSVRAGHGAAGLARGGAAPVTSSPCRRFASSRHAARRRRRRARRGARDVAGRDGRHRARIAPATSSAPTAPTARSAACSASRCTSARARYGGVQVVFRAPLWDAARRPPVRVVLRDDAGRARPVPPGRSRRPLGVRAGGAVRASADAPSSTTRGSSRRSARGRRRRPRSAHRAHRAVPLAGPAGRAVPRGRTFLVGDAAHRVTPRGGTGMNTALQSGYDLGWKLAMGAAGLGRPDLLDTLRERSVGSSPSTTSLRSTDPNGSRRPVVDELSVDLGGRVAHAWLPAASGHGLHARSRSDRAGRSSPGPTGTPGTLPARRQDAPVTVRELDAVTARTLGVRGDGALLVRPDGVPVRVSGRRRPAPPSSEVH